MKPKDIKVCKECSGTGYNGWDRELPPNRYFCDNCKGSGYEIIKTKQEVDVPSGDYYYTTDKGVMLITETGTNLRAIKLNHKIGDKIEVVCDACGGSGEESCESCIEHKACGNNYFPECQPCPTCKGKSKQTVILDSIKWNNGIEYLWRVKL